MRDGTKSKDLHDRHRDAALLAFPAYVQQMLVPELKRSDVGVMDNLSAHKVAGVEAAIRVAGARVKYLPPCSPDLNPIQIMFAKLKAHLRNVKA